MKVEDFITGPCGCGECLAANVAEESQRRDPHTGQWMHGYQLRRWLDARKRFQELARTVVGKKGRHANGFEKLASHK